MWLLADLLALCPPRSVHLQICSETQQSCVIADTWMYTLRIKGGQGLPTLVIAFSGHYQDTTMVLTWWVVHPGNYHGQYFGSRLVRTVQKTVTQGNACNASVAMSTVPNENPLDPIWGIIASSCVSGIAFTTNYTPLLCQYFALAFCNFASSYHAMANGQQRAASIVCYVRM